MNYNIPYYNMMPMARAMTMPLRGASGGLFSRLFSGLNFSSILSNTQKTLNLVNQAIPIVKQINPFVKNAKTMFRVINEFKKVDDKPNSDLNISSTNQTNKHVPVLEKETSTNIDTRFEYTEGPVFFIN